MSEGYEIINENMDMLSKIEELYKDLKNSGSAGAGQILKYKDCVVNIEIANSEFIFNYNEERQKQVVKDTINKYRDATEEPFKTLEKKDYLLIKKVLEEILEQF